MVFRWDVFGVVYGLVVMAIGFNSIFVIGPLLNNDAHTLLLFCSGIAAMGFGMIIIRGVKE